MFLPGAGGVCVGGGGGGERGREGVGEGEGAACGCVNVQLNAVFGRFLLTQSTDTVLTLTTDIIILISLTSAAQGAGVDL